jgi:hypothetical protein
MGRVNFKGAPSYKFMVKIDNEYSFGVHDISGVGEVEEKGEIRPTPVTFGAAVHLDGENICSFLRSRNRQRHDIVITNLHHDEEVCQVITLERCGFVSYGFDRMDASCEELLCNYVTVLPEQWDVKIEGECDGCH